MRSASVAAAASTMPPPPVICENRRVALLARSAAAPGAAGASPGRPRTGPTPSSTPKCALAAAGCPPAGWPAPPPAGTAGSAADHGRAVRRGRCERSASISDSASAHDSGGPPAEALAAGPSGSVDQLAEDVRGLLRTEDLQGRQVRDEARPRRPPRRPSRGPRARSPPAPRSKPLPPVQTAAWHAPARMPFLGAASVARPATTPPPPPASAAGGSRNRRRPSRASRARSARGPCEATPDGNSRAGRRSRYRYTRVRGPAVESRRTQRSST